MKDNILRCFMAIIAIGILPNAVEAQTTYGCWTGVELRKPLTRSLSVSVSPEFRFTNSPLRLDDFLLEAEIRFRIYRWLQLEGGYRYSRFYDDEFNDRFKRHRHSAGIRSRFYVARFGFTYRFQYQHSTIYWYDYGYSVESKDNLRNRLQVSYNIPRTKIEPFVMGEIYYDISSGKQHEFNRFRFRVGVSYPFNKRNEIEVFGQYQDKLNAKDPMTTYAVGVFYSHKFRQPKRSVNDTDSDEDG